MNVFSTASFCAKSVAEMTAKLGIWVLLANKMEIFLLKKGQNKL